MTDAVRRQLEEAGISPKVLTNATGKGKTPAGGNGASGGKKTTTQGQSTPKPTAEEKAQHQRTARLRPLFDSTMWDEEAESYRWVAHGLTQAQKDYLDKAAQECGIRPGR